MPIPVVSGLAAVVLREDFKRLSEEAREGRVASAAYQQVSERLSEIEVSLEQEGWLRFDDMTSRELSRVGLQRMIRLARLMYISNPLINRGVSVQADYVWAKGLSVSARNPNVNYVIQHFMDDPNNRVEFTRLQARQYKEVELLVSGNVFAVLFANARSWVNIRSIPIEQISQIVTSPDDSRSPWYYRREWVQQEFDPSNGMIANHQHVEYYPDYRYDPKGADRLETIGTYKVNWDSPIYHVRFGGMDGMLFGVPEIYPALDWARAAHQDLQTYASIHQALSRWAWTLVMPNSPNAVQGAKTRLRSTANFASATAETNPPAITGSTFIRTPDVNMSPIQTRGMAPNPEEGQRLWIMAAAGLGVPYTFFGDPSVGNLATAKTLDRPTELKYTARQELWKDVHKDILMYQVRAIAREGYCNLSVRVDINDWGEEEEVIVDNTTGEVADLHIDVNFPSLLEKDVKERVDSVIDAATLTGKAPAGTMSPKLMSRLLLDALQVDDIDEEMKVLFPPEDMNNPAIAASNRERFVSAMATLHNDLRAIIELPEHEVVTNGNGVHT